jgi:beta-galactosidase/beta-glucuronidase
MATIAHTEYPRPQLARESYLNLNGEWDFARCKRGAPYSYDRTIIVPFSPESRASGLGDFVLQPDEEIHYRRSFTMPGSFIRDKTLLHFGAVDYECFCSVNGVFVGSHRGGYLPFSFDVTDAARAGGNMIELSVTDPTDTGTQARGKQKLARGGIWYTPQSGIWQTVWIESVSADYVRDILITPDISSKSVTIEVDSAADDVSVSVFDGDSLVGTCASRRATIDMAGRDLWSPENPKLYDVVVTTPGDTIRSYFGMRKFSIGFDGDYLRLFLNHAPYFHRGVLDQGYWSEGLLTAPDDDSVIRELELVKSMGFNMIRKHIKVEPLRWYYHCDRLGILVWQDFVCGGGPYRFPKVALLPFLGLRLRDTDYRLMERDDAEGRAGFVRDMRETVATLRNCVGLCTWVLFNEGWGQFDSARLTRELKEIDRTRFVDSASGWHDQDENDWDMFSMHTYYTRLKVPRRPGRVIVLSEFGGYSLKISGHVFDEKKLFGYRVFSRKDERGNFDDLRSAYRALIEERLAPLIPKGLSASVYTQLSDVEEEINGFVTYDRKVVKIDPDFVRALNEKLVCVLPDSCDSSGFTVLS